MCRQSVRGFCVKQPFRKGCWVKGARSLTALDKVGLACHARGAGTAQGGCELEIEGSLI